MARKQIKHCFQAENNPYYIFAPGYTHRAAGVRCLHYLCHILNELGYEAYVPHGTRISPHLRTPRLDPETIKNHFLSGKTPISVYPEVAYEYSFQTPSKALWLLNTPGTVGGPKILPADALIFHFAEWITPQERESARLTTPLVDLRIFNNDNNEHDQSRTLTCYYAHKYLIAGFQVPDAIKDGSISLCQDIPRSPEEIAAILRRSKVLYCYEQSSITNEALLCGCPVLRVPSDYLTKEGWNPPGTGWADEPGILEKLTREVNDYRALYENSNSYMLDSILDFASSTQQRLPLHQARERPSKIEALWLLAPEQRAKHVNQFLEALSREEFFAHHASATDPALVFSAWIDQSVAKIIPSSGPATTTAPPPKTSNVETISVSDENRLIQKLDKLIRQGADEEAIQLMELLIERQTTRWEIHDMLGGIYIERGLMDKAISILPQGASLEFSSTNCLRKLAAAFTLQNRLWQALATCAQILKREPDDGELHIFVRDILVSTNPRIDNISWIEPEWNVLQEELAHSRHCADQAHAFLTTLQEKARRMLETQNPFETLKETRQHTPFTP
ncbi:tetratricopeptide repeat protein [Pseudothauera nasutitermitis]|uniref:Tetratricopeptide repeat protein n=1 Tax=Pseudothauera nasutitermitis TaxID=2565930 RepID=A0A4S4B036_9RHOO|nr:tetratricopeptide repeat protein [Pseudothauera nasutitermitis]THF65696.1 tetratricopeptide repeat protein [Pseudothauera nasutitermitis]